MLEYRLGKFAAIGAGWISFALSFSCVRADCLDAAARQYAVDTNLVRAIAQHESGMNARAIHRNANGSYDIGLMQINSSWLPTLRQYGIGREQLLDPCINAYVGTWILRSNIDRYGPTWKSVGAYNAASADKQLRYANAVYAVWQALPTSP